jgi:hypothetical protein
MVHYIMERTLEKIDTSPEAVAERRASLARMKVHNDLEGLPPSSPEANKIHERLVLGEITTDEAVAEIKKLHNLV